MTRTLLVLLLLSLMAPAMARVSHVSINKSQFTLGEYPRLRMNVVAERADASSLEFIIRQKNSDEKLMVEQVSPFLLLLTGVEDVTDPQATLIVREYVVNNWRDYKIIPLFGGEAKLAPKAKAAAVAPVNAGAAKTVPTNPEPVTAVNAPKLVATNTSVIKQHTQALPTPSASASSSVSRSDSVNANKAGDVASRDKGGVSISPAIADVKPVSEAQTKLDAKVPAASVAAALLQATTPVSQAPSNGTVNAAIQVAQGEDCKVEYKGGETLWRIASRYAPNWNSNVYGTMLALFEANPQAFRSGKINGLKDGAPLVCPSAALLARYPDTREAKKQFESQQAQ